MQKLRFILASLLMVVMSFSCTVQSNSTQVQDDVQEEVKENVQTFEIHNEVMYLHIQSMHLNEDNFSNDPDKMYIIEMVYPKISDNCILLYCDEEIFNDIAKIKNISKFLLDYEINTITKHCILEFLPTISIVVDLDNLDTYLIKSDHD